MADLSRRIAAHKLALLRSAKVTEVQPYQREMLAAMTSGENVIFKNSMKVGFTTARSVEFGEFMKNGATFIFRSAKDSGEWHG